MMRDVLPHCVTPRAILGMLAFGSVLAGAALAARADTLAAFAVHIHQTPLQSWGPGAGIYLGQGVFMTAAHVAGRTWWTKPKVVIDGKPFVTHTLREGSFDSVDIALLRVDEQLLPMKLRLRRMKLCTAPPAPGQDVVTVIPGAIVHSRILARERLPADLRRYGSVISDVANTGNSGSGVFDARLKCLMGIMSRKLSIARRNASGAQVGVTDIAKYFVPAAEIAAFLPPDFRL